MISAWDIYWVMQLDSINGNLGTFAVIAIIVGGILWITRRVCLGLDDKESAQVAANIKFSGPLLILGLIAWAGCSALPSTKTAAMMVVVPRIANNQAIQKEAGDLYGIAKDALRNLAAPKQEARHD